MPPVAQILLPLIIALPLIVFWLSMFSNMMDNPRLLANEKTTWTLAFLFMNVFAAIIYYTTQYRNQP